MQTAALTVAFEQGRVVRIEEEARKLDSPSLRTWLSRFSSLSAWAGRLRTSMLTASLSYWLSTDTINWGSRLTGRLSTQ